MLPDTDDAERRAAKFERIAQVLIDRVDRLEETRGSAWSMFQAAVALEQEALARTRDLERALADLSEKNRDLAVARAAAFGSKVVVLDEPTAALGVRESNQVLQLVRDLRDRGLPVILISHNMPHMFDVADRIHIQRLGKCAATITPHHLLYNRNALFTGGIRPHYYCLPVLKRETHRVALVEAATSGNPRFFLGTDSAPHARDAKETACGCAGCYTALHALELYAEAFDHAGALDKLEGFASFFGADFYGLPRSAETVTLRREAWELPREIFAGDTPVVPLRGGETIGWKLA